MLKKPKIVFNSHGESGNIHYILALVCHEFRKQRRITEYNDIVQRVTTSGNYKEALAVIREKIDLIDLDGKF